MWLLLLHSFPFTLAGRGRARRKGARRPAAPRGRPCQRVSAPAQDHRPRRTEGVLQDGQVGEGRVGVRVVGESSGGGKGGEWRSAWGWVEGRRPVGTSTNASSRRSPATNRRGVANGERRELGGGLAYVGRGGEVAEWWGAQRGGGRGVEWGGQEARRRSRPATNARCACRPSPPYCARCTLPPAVPICTDPGPFRPRLIFLIPFRQRKTPSAGRC